jgi:hypothetical protein
MFRNRVRLLEFKLHSSILPGVFMFFLFLISDMSVQAFVFSEVLSSCIVYAVLSFSLMFSRPSLGPIWPPIHWVRGVLSPVVSSPSVKRTIRFHPVPRLRISSALLVLQTRPCVAYRVTSLYLRLATFLEVCRFCHVFVCNLAAEVRLFSRCL